jgi:hypothetical protein
VAQAADLPVKARAVEYVKVCSIYGAGFYYIPGTDTCVKVGGYVRVDIGINAAGSHGPYVSGAGGRNARETPGYETRVRGIFSFDARSQTEWGTLRAYMRGGWELNSGDANYRGVQYLDRAFIQFGGLTVGKTQSFFGFYNNALNYSTLQGGGQSDAGLNLIAYTVQFAGGFSATIAAEDAAHHRAGLHDSTTAGGNILPIGAIPGGNAPAYGDYAAQRIPDIVGNLRVDQPWGSAQLSAAFHEVRGSYVGANTIANPVGPTMAGFAVQGGVRFNVPWAQGDEFWVQGTFAHGATNYLGYNPFVHTGTQFAMYNGGLPTNLGGNGSLGVAYALDGVFNNTGGSLTNGWSVIAAFQHYWTPSLRTSVFGHYTKLSYGATGNAMMCTSPAAGAAVNGIVTVPNCNFDFATIQVGSRTVWSPARNLDIGVEVLYTRLDQNLDVGGGGNALTVGGPNGSRPAGTYTARDQDTWSGTIRFQRNFWP